MKYGMKKEVKLAPFIQSSIWCKFIKFPKESGIDIMYAWILVLQGVDTKKILLAMLGCNISLYVPSI